MTSLARGLNAAIAGESFDDIAFQLPWTARAFAIMLAASRTGHFTLKAFQASLIKSIAGAEASGCAIVSEEQYYTCWIEALTALLESKQMFSDQQLALAEDKVRARLIAIERDHDHDHDHDHGHGHGRGHEHSQQLPAPLYREPGLCK